mmetsp:Transcript_105321/g.274130  ORF Transcript_105321/g.274130 Transcript_105321/m.274130 type:complete len:265 (-) Transcript_105321:247-1041(-)
MTLRSLVRKRWPPPHASPQSPQSFQDRHSQSVGATSGHAPASVTGPAHGRPSPLATLTPRVREAWRLPLASVASQPDHSCHSSKMQSAACRPQRPSLQERVTRNVPLQAFPPPTACETICRSCSWCPPPQLLEHLPHSLQWLILQSATSSAVPSSQASVSCMAPWHASPCGPPGDAMLRSRVRCVAPDAQCVQSAQSLKLHDVLALHFSSSQTFVCVRDPWHCLPLHAACLRMNRDLEHKPSHCRGSSQSSQSLNLQSAGSQLS